MPAYEGKMVANAMIMATTRTYMTMIMAVRTYMTMIMVVRTCMTGAESSGRKPV